MHIDIAITLLCVHNFMGFFFVVLGRRCGENAKIG